MTAIIFLLGQTPPFVHSGAFLGGVSRGRHVASGTSPVCVSEGSWSSKKFVSVSSKVVTLRLEEVGGEHAAPVTVVEGESGGEAGRGHTYQHCLRHNATPGSLRFVDGVSEKFVD